MRNLPVGIELQLFQDFDTYVNTDVESGHVFWKESRSNQLKGTRCGSDIQGKNDKTPYRVVRFKSRNIRLHRFLFWKRKGYVVDIIDHENGNGLDNRAVNLRESNHSHNMFNCHQKPTAFTGHRNIYVRKSGTYYVQVKVDGKNKTLGTCQTIDEAIKLRDQFYAN